MDFYMDCQLPTDKVNITNEYDAAEVTIICKEMNYCLLDENNDWVVGTVDKELTSDRVEKVLSDIFGLPKSQIKLYETGYI